ncbi:hypothetical protein CHH90_14870 [Bacillus licheniformis]|nr:hypothetical protein AB684_02465 [Bacillus licheniformis]APJ25762.1 hypothetical protein BSZ43_02515 [Bacillus sp. H15-1]ASV14095.1 hypothetical protein CJO35_02515 [Bacillus sp. 1s-1]EQM24987.1 hypothetical protein N399_02455 [Bacillus licheniformis CG-B52]MBY8349082.1 hypothetical protein [Bacillus sp. PCH94]MSO00347.1 hypothetical protein [Bacillus paralicheniformis]NBB45974.1 hypothetical protein [Bacillus sp. y1(2019)]
MQLIDRKNLSTPSERFFHAYTIKKKDIRPILKIGSPMNCAQSANKMKALYYMMSIRGSQK